MILRSSFTADAVSVIWAVILVSSLFLVVALGRAGSVLFWKYEAPSGATLGTPPPGFAYVPAALCLAAVVSITAFAAPVTGYAEGTASDLLQPEAYREAVLEGTRDGTAEEA